MSDKDKVFEILCHHSVSVMDGWIPYPSTCIASTTGWSLYKVRKLLKELKQEGLIDSDIYVENSPDLDRPILVRGYVLTKKALDTEAYEIAWEAERKACQECFEFDIGPCDKKVIDEEDEWIDL
jgi:hypothetical protein